MEEDQEKLLHSRSPGARKSALSPSDWRSFAFIGGSLSARGRRPAFAKAPARLADDGSFWGKRLYDFFEARIAAERIPDREQFQGAVAQHLRCDGSTQSSFQLLQGKLLLARPRCCNGEILKDATAVDDIFFQRRERDRPPAFVQGQVFPPKSSVD